MAGLGTSGSLVAGAALLFVLGSAIVAFRGWPQIATGPATTYLTLAAQPIAPSQAARRLAAVLRRRGVTATVAPASAGWVRGGAPGRGHTGSRTGVGSYGSMPGGPGAPITTPGVGPSASATSATAAASGGCNTTSCTTPQSVVTHLTKTVAQQVTSIGSSVGSQIGSTGGSLGGSLSGVSPPVGNAAQNGGSTTGNAVSGTATTAGNALNQVGSALGGGH